MSTTADAHPAQLRTGVLVAIGALVLGLADLTHGFRDDYDLTTPAVVTMLMFTLAAALYRLAPGAALALVWLASSVLVLSSSRLMAVQLVVSVVAYGAARHGSAATVWLSGLSIPVGAIMGAYVIRSDFSLVYRFYQPLYDLVGTNANRIGPVTLVAIGLVLLAVPWLVGLLLRSVGQTATTQQERAAAEARQHEAEEIAELRAAQARLAHDVHDVVGHSLAVILAQAESAQFLPSGDDERIRRTLANVAASARQSLQDVRAVLADDAGAVPSSSTSLDELLESLRIAGNDVRATVDGAPRPLPPELAVVAYRVLQEMLTNALRHGVRGEPVHVRRSWGDELVIEVVNAAAPDPGETPRIDGLGLEGMRRRVVAVGGALDVEPGGDAFTVRARLPVRTVAA